MKYQSKFAALLLASASTLGLAHAQTDNVRIIGLQVADASAQPSSAEIVRVTADDQSGGGMSAGSAPSNVGTIDVQGAGTTLGSGYIVPEDGPKERSTVTKQGIANLIPTSNPYQMISILPGVNQFQDDPLGLSGGTIRVRGLTAAEMGFTVNGAPINDSGSFAVYPNELIDAENVAQVWVSQGSTDIDAPHVGASGGNIGVVTRAPSDFFGVRAEETAGQDSLLREFVSLDTGWIGDFKGFGSVSFTDADKWRGDGTDRRWHSDGSLLWQFLPHSSVGLIWSYNDGQNDAYRSYGGAYFYYPGDYEVGTSGHTALQTFNEVGRNADYDTFWGNGANYPINLYGPYSSHAPTCNTGPTSNTPICLVSNPNFPQTQTTNVTNYWKLNINPFKNALVTLPIHVELTDDLRWETNGYVWYGDGGLGFGTTEQEGYSIVDGYKVGLAYGNAVGSQNELLLYEYEHTLTWRPGFTSKLIYDYRNLTFMGGVWYEHAAQKQNEPFSIVNPDGSPCTASPNTVTGCNLFGTTTTGGPSVPVEGYNDKVDSVGQSAYFQITGRFLDDALKLNFGMSLRNIHRSDYTHEPVCFDSPNMVYEPFSTTTTCASVATSSTFMNSSAYQFFGGPTIGAAAAYAAMQRYAANPHVSYTRLLPELNMTYDVDPYQQVYAGVSTGYRTPSTNNLWQDNSSGTVLETTDIKPEFSTSWEAGYRYHGDFVTASTTAFLHNITNYQATLQIDPTDFINTNIGGVTIYGLDAEAGTTPWHGFTFYWSGELMKSALDSNIQAGACGTNSITCTGGAANGTPVYIPSSGRQLVDTPEWSTSASIGYEQEGFFGSITPHCYGQRATSLMNDEFVPANCTVDASAGYHFNHDWGILHDATLQVFALNLFDSSYLSQISTTADTNAKTITNAYTSVGSATIPEGSSSTTNYAAKPGSPFFIGVRLNANLN